MSEISFSRLEHPTGPNGDCPICYSKGYEDAEQALEATVAELKAALEGIVSCGDGMSDIMALASALSIAKAALARLKPRRRSKNSRR